jgi:hypothetical protein
MHPALSTYCVAQQDSCTSLGYLRCVCMHLGPWIGLVFSLKRPTFWIVDDAGCCLWGQGRLVSGSYSSSSDRCFLFVCGCVNATACPSPVLWVESHVFRHTLVSCTAVQLCIWILAMPVHVGPWIGLVFLLKRPTL